MRHGLLVILATLLTALVGCYDVVAVEEVAEVFRINRLTGEVCTLQLASGGWYVRCSDGSTKWTPDKE